MYLSIVIPTTREVPETPPDCEVLIQREKGLVNARNAGWRKAKGGIIAFIDDDVVLDKDWAREIVEDFRYPKVGAVMGGVITNGKNRDNDWTHPIMQKFFRRMGGVQACNMAFRKSVLEEVGGFDNIYKDGVGEWSEPDLVYKVKKAGYIITHNDGALLWHYPSPKGIYQERGEHSYWRMRNFLTFRKRWLKWDWDLVQVVAIFYCYWFYKFLKTRDIKWLGGLCAL